jgi:hypothetical protein
VPLDPKYAQFMTGGGDRGDKFPSIPGLEIGEGFVAEITFVGDTFEKKNNLHVPATYSADGQVLKEAQGRETVTTMKVNVILKKLRVIGDNGMETKELNEPRTVWVQKWGQFKSIVEAVAAANEKYGSELSDLTVGWTWSMQRIKQTEKNSNAHAFKSKLDAPSE